MTVINTVINSPDHRCTERDGEVGGADYRLRAAARQHHARIDVGGHTSTIGLLDRLGQPLAPTDACRRSDTPSSSVSERLASRPHLCGQQHQKLIQRPIRGPYNWPLAGTSAWPLTISEMSPMTSWGPPSTSASGCSINWPIPSHDEYREGENLPEMQQLGLHGLAADLDTDSSLPSRHPDATPSGCASLRWQVQSHAVGGLHG